MKNPFKCKSIRRFVEELGYANIDVKPVDYDWTSNSHKDYCEGRSVDNDSGLWREVYPKFDLANANMKLADQGEDPIEPDDPSDDDSVEEATEEANAKLHELYNENSEFQPMMNYYYPLDAYHWKDDPEGLQARLDIFGGSCLLVEMDEKVVLTLMGGGMDLTWDICTAYILAGSLPPAHFASDLPEFAGMELNKKNKIIIAACERSLRGMVDRQQRGLDRLRSVRKALSGNSKKVKV